MRPIARSQVADGERRNINVLERMFEGRIRRKDYLLSAIVSPIVVIIFVLLAGIVIRMISHTVAALFMLMVFAVGFLHSLSINAKRCHDIGLSGWMQLIPLFTLVLAFKAGDKGPNKYGADPKQAPLQDGDDLDFRRPQSSFDAEMALIRADRERSTLSL